MTTKAAVINGALRLLRTRKLTANELATNSREAARIANEVWDSDFVRGCLESGNWRFATRSQQIISDPGIDPQFSEGGLQYAFQKSTDWLRTVGVFQDADMRITYSDYMDEGGFIFANLESLYVRFVSDDADFGGNLTLWPRSFQEFVEAKLASLMAGPMTKAGDEMIAYADQLLQRAQSRDVINEPTRNVQLSSWATARFGGWSRGQRRAGS